MGTISRHLSRRVALPVTLHLLPYGSVPPGTVENCTPAIWLRQEFSTQTNSRGRGGQRLAACRSWARLLCCRRRPAASPPSLGLGVSLQPLQAASGSAPSEPAAERSRWHRAQE